jgi:hypothetical protein
MDWRMEVERTTELRKAEEACDQAEQRKTLPSLMGSVACFHALLEIGEPRMRDSD